MCLLDVKYVVDVIEKYAPEAIIGVIEDKPQAKL